MNDFARVQANARLNSRALGCWIFQLEVRLIIAAFWAFVPHVIHGAAIAFPEAVAEVLARFPFDGWVLVHFMVVGIGVAMFAEIVPCGFDAFVITALLDIAIIGRWLIPAIAILALGNGRC